MNLLASPCVASMTQQVTDLQSRDVRDRVERGATSWNRSTSRTTDSNRSSGRTAPSRRTSTGSISSNRSTLAKLGRPCGSHAPVPTATYSGRSLRFDVSCTPASWLPSRPMITTGRSLPCCGSSSNGTQVHTTSPGSGSPSRFGEYSIRTPGSTRRVGGESLRTGLPVPRSRSFCAACSRLSAEITILITVDMGASEERVGRASAGQDGEGTGRTSQPRSVRSRSS